MSVSQNQTAQAAPIATEGSPRSPGRLRWGIGILLGVGVLINYFDRVSFLPHVYKTLRVFDFLIRSIVRSCPRAASSARRRYCTRSHRRARLRSKRRGALRSGSESKERLDEGVIVDTPNGPYRRHHTRPLTPSAERDARTPPLCPSPCITGWNTPKTPSGLKNGCRWSWRGAIQTRK
jgi:hypothetical protein